MPTYQKPTDAESELQQLLLEAVPKNKFGNKTLNELARVMHLSKQAIRKWINKGSISPERALQIVEISKIKGYDVDGKPILGTPRVKLNDLHRFVYKE